MTLPSRSFRPWPGCTTDMENSTLARHNRCSQPLVAKHRPNSPTARENVVSEKVTASVPRQSDDPGSDHALAKIRCETSLDDLIAFSLLHRPRTAPSGFGALLAILVGAIGAVILIVADKQGSPLSLALRQASSHLRS